MIPISPDDDRRAYQEDVARLLWVIKMLKPEATITLNDLAGALRHTGLSPRLLYEHATAGYYTREMARLDEALGLPAKEVTSLGGYWQDRLVEVAKQYGKPVETVGDDLARAVEESAVAGFFLSKEELAQAIVLLNEWQPPSINIEEVQTNLLRLADETVSSGTEKPAKKADKTPYYHKSKKEWWK